MSTAAYQIQASDADRIVRATLHRWWMFAKSLSESTVDKAVKTVKRVIDLAGREGVKVNAIRTKPIRPKAAAKHYLDDLQIACLWSAAE